MRMVTTFRWFALTVIVSTLVGCCTTDPRKVAVLISAESAEINDSSGNTEFWNDTVATYCMLRANGFSDKNIFVLYGDGHDGYHVPINLAVNDVSGPDSYYIPTDAGFCQDAKLKPKNSRVTDFPMSVFVTVQSDLHETAVGCREGLEPGTLECRNPACWQDDSGLWTCPPAWLLGCLATGCSKEQVAAQLELFECPGCPKKKVPALKKDDYLFVYWKGHGSVEFSVQPETFDLSIGGWQVTPAQVSSWMDGIAAQHRSLVFDVCNSGCIDQLDSHIFASHSSASGEGSVAPIVLAASRCDQKSLLFDTNNFDPIHYHGAWTYWISCTLRGHRPGFITNSHEGKLDNITLWPGGPLGKAFEQSFEAVTTQVGTSQTPVLKDPDAYSEFTYIDVGDPAGNAKAKKAASETLRR